jgi:hypothetical protein
MPVTTRNQQQQTDSRILREYESRFLQALEAAQIWRHRTWFALLSAFTAEPIPFLTPPMVPSTDAVSVLEWLAPHTKAAITDLNVRHYHLRAYIDLKGIDPTNTVLNDVRHSLGVALTFPSNAYSLSQVPANTGEGSGMTMSTVPNLAALRLSLDPNIFPRDYGSPAVLIEGSLVYADGFGDPYGFGTGHD